MKIKEAFAVYTGGSIWLFYGSLEEEGKYFFTDDDGWTLILDANPGDDLDSACYEEWQKEHYVKGLLGDKRIEFAMSLLDKIAEYGSDYDHTGGFTETDDARYRVWMKLDR